MNRHVLVTGANGQLGNALRQAVQSSSSGDSYLFTDVNELDITDIEAIGKCVKDNGIDTIVNCAAYTNVDKAEDDYELANLLNNTAAGNLAKVAGECGATLIHISTDYVFDGAANVPYAEQCQSSPIGVYGVTKLAGEQSVINSGTPYIIIRTSWLYSPWGGNFVKTMLRLTAERESLGVIFDQIGTPTYAVDLAAVIVKIIADNQLDNVGVYHFSNEGVCSWYDFAQEINEIGANCCKIAPLHSWEYPSKVTRPHYSVLDKSKIKSTFGVEIPYWRDSLVRCIKKIQNNEL